MTGSENVIIFFQVHNPNPSRSFLCPLVVVITIKVKSSQVAPVLYRMI